MEVKDVLKSPGGQDQENVTPAISKDKHEEPSREKFLKIESFERLSLNERIQHIVLFSSFIVLVITGFPLKYPNAEILNAIFIFTGGAKGASIIHRIAAVALILVFLFHNFSIWKMIFQGKIHLRDVILFVPGPKDAKDIIHNFRYFLGLTPNPPRFGKFSYIEKFDYWAVYWGMFIMGGSGIILWFPEFCSQYVGLDIIRIAYIAHSDEALLAFLAITCWHMYNVHLNPRCFPMNWVWLTGMITREEMQKEHPLEYEREMAEAEKRERRKA